jgi:hypothetical protein
MKVNIRVCIFNKKYIYKSLIKKNGRIDFESFSGPGWILIVDTLTIDTTSLIRQLQCQIFTNQESV